jgi:predicted dehydrogenase
LKVGILGCGNMGATVVEHLKECSLVSGIIAQDIRPSHLEELRCKYGIEVTDSAEQLVSDKDVKVVFVTSSNDTHKDLTLMAMNAGKPVLCEKPMAVTLDDAREMVEESERLGVFLQIGFELRYSLLYTKIKEWIDSGLLGDIINTHCMYRVTAYEKGAWRNDGSRAGGTFGERLSHYVDLPRWWIGTDVTEVISMCAPNVLEYMNVLDNYHTTYRFSNGAVSHVTFTMGTCTTHRGDPLRNRIGLQQGDGHTLSYVVMGTKGAASTDIFDRFIKRWEYQDTPSVLECNWVEDLHWPEDQDHFYFHNTTHQTWDIVRRISEGLPPMTPARDAYETMRLVAAAERSADTGQIIKLCDI